MQTAQSCKAAVTRGVCRVIWLVLLLGLVAQPAWAQERPRPTPHRLVIVSVDGLRPDLMLRAQTPHLRALMNRGVYTMWAETTDVAVTLPSHASMLTGVEPEVHGVNWNADLPEGQVLYPSKPTLLELGRRAGYTAGVVAGKSKFDTLFAPGSTDYLWISNQTSSENEPVMEAAIEMISTRRPDILFLHLAETDKLGHAFGWGGPEIIAGIERVDTMIGRLVTLLEREGDLDNTFILISADHGGSGRNHGANDPRSRYIPWILVGPGIRKGIDLTLYRDVTVRTEDTFATAAMLMKIPVPEPVTGRPVPGILAEGELLVPATQPAGGGR